MLDSQVLILSRDSIIQQANAIGIKEVYVCNPFIEPSQQEVQYFLIDTGNQSIDNQAFERFRTWVKEKINYLGEVIFFNKGGLELTMVDQAESFQLQFQNTLHSAKALSQLDNRPLSEQLNEALASRSTKEATSKPPAISSQIPKTAPIFAQTNTSVPPSQDTHRGKKHRIEQVTQELTKIVEKEDSDVREQSTLQFVEKIAEHANLNTLRQMREMTERYVQRKEVEAQAAMYTTTTYKST